MTENKALYFAWHKQELLVIDSYVKLKHHPTKKNAEKAVAALVNAAQARARVDLDAVAAEEAREIAALF